MRRQYNIRRSFPDRELSSTTYSVQASRVELTLHGHVTRFEVKRWSRLGSGSLRYSLSFKASYPLNFFRPPFHDVDNGSTTPLPPRPLPLLSARAPNPQTQHPHQPLATAEDHPFRYQLRLFRQINPAESAGGRAVPALYQVTKIVGDPVGEVQSGCRYDSRGEDQVDREEGWDESAGGVFEPWRKEQIKLSLKHFSGVAEKLAMASGTAFRWD